MKNLLFLFTLLFIVSCNNSEEQQQTSGEILKQTSTTPSTGVQNDKVFPKLESNRYNVAFLIMDGTYNTELTAPYDIFQHTIFRDSIKAMNVLR